MTTTELFELLSEDLKDLVLEHAARSCEFTNIVKWSTLRRCNETIWQRACVTRKWNDKPQHFTWRIWYARKCKPKWADRLDYKLCEASHYGHLDVVRLLLDRGVQNDEALRYASEKGLLEIVRLLLDHGADIHAENDYALRYASRNDHLEVVLLLIDRGADIHANNDEALRHAN